MPYVYHSFNAMTEIADSMNWVMFTKDDDDIDEKAQKIYERNYIITLVATLCKGGYQIPGLMNGEVAKSLDIEGCEISNKYAEIKKMLKPDYKSKPKYVFPDFLIHESHNPQELIQSKQHFIIEAKTSPIDQKELFYLDFLKLNYYIKHLNYENAAYLIVNNKLATIQQYLDDYLREIGLYYDEIFRQLFFFIQDDIKSYPKLYKIVNK